MPVYIYKALDTQGKSVKGEIEAKNETELHTHLAKYNLSPIKISYKAKAAKSEFFLERFLKGTGKVNIQALVIFTRQFSTFVKTAVPLVEGLGILAEQAEDPVLKEALQQIIQDIQEGRSISQAMAKYPAVFSELYINTVVAGESGGLLAKVLLQLADMLDHDLQTRANIKSALWYPIMVVVALLVATVVLSVFVIPPFVKIYADVGLALPLPTKIMIFISNIMLGPWKESGNIALILLWFLILLGMFLGLVFLFIFFIHTKRGRFIWDGWKFNLPVVGKIYQKIAMLRFASMLSLLYRVGLPVLKTLDIVGLTIGNVVLVKEIETIKRDVAGGKGISQAILNSKSFPKMVGYMVSVGEKSGSLPVMLDSVYEYFDLEVKSTIKNLTVMIEPILTAVLGIIVLGMALAIFLPMWDLIKIAQKTT